MSFSVKALSHQWRRLQRERLRWPCIFSGNFAFGNWPFFYGKQWRSCKAIQHKYEAHLGDLRDGWNLLSIAASR